MHHHLMWAARATSLSFFILATLAMPAAGQTTRPAPVSDDAEAGSGDEDDEEPSAGESTAEPPADRPRNFWTRELALSDWGGARTELKDAGIRLELLYASQYMQNFRGGLQTNNGHRFSGGYDLNIKTDFEKMGLIPGGSFYIKARGNYSDSINPDKVGALFSPNADAFRDYAIFVRKWWYKQELFDGKLEFRLGRIQNHKDLFDVSLYANHEDEDFLNRMVGRSGVIPNVNSIGAFAKVKPLEWLYIQAAVIDAQAPNRTRTGFDTAFHDEDWFDAFWEVGFTPEWPTRRGPMPGRYRIGGWYEAVPRAVFERRKPGEEPRLRTGDPGFYLGFDQMIWKENADIEDTQGLGLFARLGLADENVNRVEMHWEWGLSYQGLIPTRDEDVFGFAVAQAVLSDQYHDAIDGRADRETVYEWYYAYHLTPWCIISPDFQVITNPGGRTDARDAIVGGIRVVVNF